MTDKIINHYRNFLKNELDLQVYLKEAYFKGDLGSLEITL